MLKKRVIETQDYDEEVVTKEVFVETIVETREVVRHLDAIESQITQKENTILELQNEVDKLKAMKTQILSVNKK
jgi:conjugal transfer/entry exclusion protein